MIPVHDPDPTLSEIIQDPTWNRWEIYDNFREAALCNIITNVLYDLVSRSARWQPMLFLSLLILRSEKRSDLISPRMIL